MERSFLPRIAALPGSREESFQTTLPQEDFCSHPAFSIDAALIYLAGKSLVRYRNQPDRSLHQLRTAMHHHPLNRERAINLSVLTMSGPGEFPRVESN